MVHSEPVTLISQFEYQAKVCAKLDSPLYAALASGIAQDIGEGGPCAKALAGFADSPRDSLVPLRFLAAVHALALSGDVPDLARYYASATARPDAPDTDTWPAFRTVVAEQIDWITTWLDTPPRAPQTNEVGRVVPLLAGLLAAVDAIGLPVRLLELGSSAGLNLRADHFRWRTGDLDWGPRDSPVDIADAWQGPVPDWLTTAVRGNPTLNIIERRGCDPAPLDPLTPRGALTLRSYLWPDQSGRAERLAGALQVAEHIPADVITSGAQEFLAGIDLVPGTLTVVWHSVMRQYVDPQEWRAVTAELDRLAQASGPDTGFAHIAFEGRNNSDDRHGFRLTTRMGNAPETTLARANPHGIPAYLHPADF